ncbi:MAG TPA: hypothetical protein VMC85_21625 [Desulfomonilaceae bacterium]|nr:hypothetical protein [Desulfomonilaceae bacterium]
MSRMQEASGTVGCNCAQLADSITAEANNQERPFGCLNPVAAKDVILAEHVETVRRYELFNIRLQRMNEMEPRRTKRLKRP